MNIEPLSEHIGAEISGIHLDDLDQDEVDAIKKAWLEHKVLVFRDQQISTEAHIAFGKNFGELEIHPFADNLKDHPEIIVLEAGGDSPRQNYNCPWGMRERKGSSTIVCGRCNA